MKSKLCKTELDVGKCNMTAREANPNTEQDSAPLLTTELLILADGRILAHNITPVMAQVLAELNPADEAMNRRAMRKNTLNHELSD
jgi:hypothetical protein